MNFHFFSLAEVQRDLREAKKQLKMSKRKDYYKILGLEDRKPDVSENDIKKAYKKAALKWHPDRWSSKSQEEQDNATAMFKEAGEAVSVLSDPQKKRRYDNGEDLEDMQGMGGHDVDVNNIFNMFFGGGMGGGMGGMGGGGFHSHGGGFPQGGFNFSSRGGGFSF